MKSTFITVAALAGLSNAFPNIAAQLERNAQGKAMPKRQLPGVTPPFDAEAQYISNTGDHKFVAPGPTDQRGPCPGLNAMANHNYLPHNGIATIDELIEANTKVFGMGLDLATFLSTYGAVMDGDLTKWSIGGPDSRVGGALGLLGTPQGISGSHNKYESDASPMMGDLYQYGNDYKLVMSQFQEFYDLGKEEDNYDLETLLDFRVSRFQESIDKNPYFFNAPFSGVIVSVAAYTFIYRFMANHTAENPEGKLNGDILKSFYSVTGEDGNFEWTPGHERIPDNWYTRNSADTYTIPYLSLDGLSQSTRHLKFFSVGGNTGTTDSFFGVNPANLTGSVYTLDNLLEGNNLFCYGLQYTKEAMPDVLSGLFSDVKKALNVLSPVFDSAVSSLGCPQTDSIDNSQFSKFPGFTENYDGYDPKDEGLLTGALSGLLG